MVVGVVARNKPKPWQIERELRLLCFPTEHQSNVKCTCLVMKLQIHTRLDVVRLHSIFMTLNNSKRNVKVGKQQPCRPFLNIACRMIFWHQLQHYNTQLNTSAHLWRLSSCRNPVFRKSACPFFAGRARLTNFTRFSKQRPSATNFRKLKGITTCIIHNAITVLLNHLSPFPSLTMCNSWRLFCSLYWWPLLSVLNLLTTVSKVFLNDLINPSESRPIPTVAWAMSSLSKRTKLNRTRPGYV